MAGLFNCYFEIVCFSDINLNKLGGCLFNMKLKRNWGLLSLLVASILVFLFVINLVSSLEIGGGFGISITVTNDTSQVSV